MAWDKELISIHEKQATEERQIQEGREAMMPAFLEALNGDLSREYSAAIQYVQHAAVMKGAAFDGIREELLNHADEEFAHAKKISDRINYLGGVPTLDVNSNMRTSEDSMELLRLNMELEDEAIARYTERIEQSNEMGDYGTTNMLMEILEEEQEHRNDLITSIGE